MIHRRSILVSLAIAGLVPCAPSARAQSYPTKSVKIIVPLAAGGLADILARLLAQRMSETTEQYAAVANRTGRPGASGADPAGVAPPEGHHLAPYPPAMKAVPPTPRHVQAYAP